MKKIIGLSVFSITVFIFSQAVFSQSKPTIIPKDIYALKGEVIAAINSNKEELTRTLSKALDNSVYKNQLYELKKAKLDLFIQRISGVKDTHLESTYVDLSKKLNVLLINAGMNSALQYEMSSYNRKLLLLIEKHVGNILIDIDIVSDLLIF